MATSEDQAERETTNPACRGGGNPELPQSSTLTFGSLFAGIGGFDLAFERVGMTPAWQVEIDRDCNRVLGHHWPDVPKFDDVRKVGAAELEPVDVISFGSPCQDLSVAGKRAGMAGERSGLFFEAIRIVRQLRPAFAVFENVPGLLSSHGGRDFFACLRAFRQCGARDVAWRILDARYWGVTQRRRRVFVVADFRGERAGQVLFEPEGCTRNPAAGGEAGAGLAPSVTPGARRASGQRSGEELTLTHTLRAEGHDGEGSLIYQCHGSTDVGMMGTLKRGNGSIQGGVPFLAFAANQRDEVRDLGMTVRRLTPTECLRLQGLPDDRLDLDPLLSDSSKYRLIGNSVAVPVVEWIGRRLMEVLHA